MKKRLKHLFIFNVLFIVIIGSLSHFVYDWSKENPIVGLFIAVNESTWEHIKLAIFPSLIIYTIQYFIYFKKSKNFCLGVFLSLLTTIVLIPVLFYGYKAILGSNFLILDLLDFIISVTVGQFVLYKVMLAKEIKNIYKIFSILGILIIIICYLTFTYFPPKNFLFKDPIDNSYGINK